MKIAYVMSHYPAVSHAFVLREVQAVRALGVDVATISVHRAPPEALLAAADREEAAGTFSILPVGWVELLRVHLRALAGAPRAYARTLMASLRLSSGGARATLWRLFYFAEAIRAWEHCERTGIDHLHAQFADSATDVAMLASMYSRAAGGSGGVSWSLAVHGSVEFYDVTRFALRPKLAHAQFAIAISHFGRSQLMMLTDEQRWSHLHVVRCGVHAEVYVPPPRSERSERAGRVRCLYVGRLLHGKGLTLLVESVRRLTGEGHDVELTLVGEGPMRGVLERRLAALGLKSRVRLAGAVGQDEITGLYAGADVFCLPSFAEGIPVVLMEAMAMELAVVSTRIMGIPELVEDGREGLLVAPGELEALLDALRRLVVSPDLRRRLGRAAREKVVREFDVRQAARRMKEVLQLELGHPESGAEADHRPIRQASSGAGAVSRAGSRRL